MPDEPRQFPDPRKEDIFAGDRRISRPDSSLPDWEMPDTAYRPIPIVWFTGAFFVQLMAIMLLNVVMPDAFPEITVALCALASGAIGKWTWDRGMNTAGIGWKAASIFMLCFNMIFAAAVAFST